MYTRYALSPWSAIAAVSRRQMVLLLRDKKFARARVMQVGHATKTISILSSSSQAVTMF